MGNFIDSKYVKKFVQLLWLLISMDGMNVMVVMSL